MEKDLLKKSLGSKIVGAIINALCYLVLRPKVYKNASLKEGSYIFLCNHTHHFDGVLVAAVLKRYKPYVLVTTKWYQKKGFVGFLVRNQRTIPIDLESDTGDMSWFKTCEEALRQGNSLLIFPEGAIAREGKMLEFKPGAGVLAEKTGTSVVPVASCGKYNMFFGSRQRVKIGSEHSAVCPENVRPSRYAKELMKDIKSEVQEMYSFLKADYGEIDTYKE